MLLDYSTTAELHTSWTVQLDWQMVDMDNHGVNQSLSDLLGKLAVAEQEDVNEENDPLWIRPLVRKKKVVRNGSFTAAHVVTGDEFHNSGTDFSSIGLRGIGPGKFGWGDWRVPPENEKAGFTCIQKALVDHYTWFRHEHPQGFWLRS